MELGELRKFAKGKNWNNYFRSGIIRWNSWQLQNNYKIFNPNKSDLLPCKEIKLFSFSLVDGYSAILGSHTNLNITIELGLVEQYKELESISITTYEDLKQDKRLLKYIEPMESLTCKHRIELKTFNYSKRFQQLNMEFINGKHQFKFQYRVLCGDGFVINFDKLEDVIFEVMDKEKYSPARDCTIFGSETLNHKSVKEYCFHEKKVQIN